MDSGEVDSLQIAQLQSRLQADVGRVGVLLQAVQEAEARIEALTAAGQKAALCRARFDQEMAKERIRLKKIQMFSNTRFATGYVERMSAIVGGQRYYDIRKAFGEIEADFESGMRDESGKAVALRREIEELEGEITCLRNQLGLLVG
jgi:hypothetical protein